MIERDIERVLEGLGRVEAPQGLEERVMRAMIEQPATRQRWFALAWAGVAALIVAGVVMAVSKQRDSALAIKEQRMARAGAVEQNAPANRASQEPLNQHGLKRAGLQSLRKEPGFERAGLQSRRKAPSIQPALAAEGTLVSGSKLTLNIPNENVAEEPSFPAPPAPLTEQERLLLRLARRPNEATIAMFDPGIREERAAAEKAEFDFLNPQPPPKTEDPQEKF